MTRATAASLRAMKARGEKIAVLTAYDFPSARLQDAAGVDAILVGDSLANAVMGHATTLSATMDDMVRHTQMAARAAQRALVIADMPFLSYHTGPRDAVLNAGRLLAEGGAQAVKLEGPVERIGESLAAIVRADIPVMGHLGLTPQSVHRLGGYGLQAEGPEGAEALVRQAQALEEAGCFALVLEKTPAAAADAVTQATAIPTIGIGAGPHCDGQVLVMHDMLGLGIKAKHTKVYADLGDAMGRAFRAYIDEVKSGAFPAAEHSYE